MPCLWIRNVYNTGPNHYLSDVWLEQAKRRRNGAYVQYPVCEPGAWNGDFYQIKPRPDEAIVTKHRYGAFEGTDLDLILRSRGIRSVIMTGVATNVCVETTARQAFLRDYYVVFTNDCSATFSQAQHDADSVQHRSVLRPGCLQRRDHRLLAGGGSADAGRVLKVRASRSSCRARTA